MAIKIRIPKGKGGRFYRSTPVIMGGNRVLVMATFIGQQFRTVLDYPLGATAAGILMALAALLTVRCGITWRKPSGTKLTDIRPPRRGMITERRIAFLLSRAI